MIEVFFAFLESRIGRCFKIYLSETAYFITMPAGGITLFPDESRRSARFVVWARGKEILRARAKFRTNSIRLVLSRDDMPRFENFLRGSRSVVAARDLAK